jgi:hypothetical protein
MIKLAGAFPIKSRVPFEAWVLAGLVTVLSIASSLTHIAPGSMDMDQGKEPKAHHAGAN